MKARTTPILLAALAILSTLHDCPYQECPMRGEILFSGCGSCPEDSDCYALDAVHWENPYWDYEQCEHELFTNQTK